jgi:diguanylate cyclase (GGDEF)-like protein
MRIFEPKSEKSCKSTGITPPLLAASGQEALAQAEHEIPDLLLLNLVMPEMDGYQVCEHLQASKKTSRIPIIVISAQKSSQYLQRSFEVGAIDYITKPIDPIELIARTASALKLKKDYDEILKAYDSIRSINEHLERMSTTDELTGVKNVRYFWEYLSREVEKFNRFKLSLSLIMADIDDFKRINDTHGHLVGDQVLKRSGKIFQQNLRNYDLVARYGGEEFAFVLVNTGLSQATTVAEKMRRLISAIRIDLGKETLQYTLSFGIAALTQDTPPENAKAEFLVDEADRALYAAKKSGKNRVVVAD